MYSGLVLKEAYINVVDLNTLQVELVISKTCRNHLIGSIKWSQKSIQVALTSVFDPDGEYF